MDRISALRNVEDALGEFEAGEITLTELERRVGAVLRTYATEFDPGSKAAYRVGAEGGVVVVAGSPSEARERATELADVSGEVERVSPPDRSGG